MNRDPEVTAKLQVHPEATSRKEDQLLPIEAIKNLMVIDLKEEHLQIEEIENLTGIDLIALRLRSGTEAIKNLMEIEQTANLTVTDLREEILNLTETDRNLMNVDHRIQLDQ